MDRHMSVKLVVKAANLSFYHILYSPAEKLVRRFSSVGQHPFFNPSEFAWIPRIEAGWPTMRDELRALLRERERIPSFHELSQEQLRITRDDKWKTYWLYGYGRKIVENCRCCPAKTHPRAPGPVCRRPPLSPGADRAPPEGGVSHPGGF